MVESCEKIMPLLSAYMDNELSRQESQIVEKHLETCPRCRSVLESYDTINADSLTVSAPEGFTERVMEKVRIEKSSSKAKKKDPKTKKEKRIIPFRCGTVAAAMAALVLLGASGVFDSIFGGAAETADTATMETAVAEAAVEMHDQLAENAEHIMSYSATMNSYPEETGGTIVTEEAEEPIEEPAAPAPVYDATEDAVEESNVAVAETTAAEVAEEEEIRTTHIGGTIINVEPSEGGYYVIISDEVGEISVLLPWSALNEYVPQVDDTISLTAEVFFDGEEYHFVALDIQ